MFDPYDSPLMLPPSDGYYGVPVAFGPKTTLRLDIQSERSFRSPTRLTSASKSNKYLPCGLMCSYRVGDR